MEAGLQFQDYQDVVLPRVYPALSCRSILTMEFVDGIKITDTQSMLDEGIQPADVAATVSKVFGQQLFVTGFLHSDPHPGNLMVRRSASTGRLQVVLLDHGLYHRFNDKTRQNLANLWQGLMETKDQDLGQACADALSMEKEPGRLLMTLLTMLPLDRVSPDTLIQNCHPDFAIDSVQLLNQEFPHIVEHLGALSRDAFMLFKTQQLLRFLMLKLRGYHFFPIQSTLATDQLSKEFVESQGNGLWVRIKSWWYLLSYHSRVQWHLLRFWFVQRQWVEPY